MEKKYSENRFVKYHLHLQWQPHGDGNDYYDWTMEDYASKAEGAPEWEQAIYPAFCGLVDLSNGRSGFAGALEAILETGGATTLNL